MQPNNPNQQVPNNMPQQPMPNQDPNINQPVSQNVNAAPNYANNPQNNMPPQQPMPNQGINMASQQPAVNQNLSNYANQAPVNSVQYNQPNNQQYVHNNNEPKPNFGIVALIILQGMYTIFSLMYMISLFTGNSSLDGLKIMLLVLFIATTIGYAFLLFKIFLKKYWALMVYVGAMAVTTTVEIKSVVAYNNLEWSYIASLIFAFTLLGLSIFLGAAKKNHFN